MPCTHIPNKHHVPQITAGVFVMKHTRDVQIVRLRGGPRTVIEYYIIISHGTIDDTHYAYDSVSQ